MLRTIKYIGWFLISFATLGLGIDTIPQYILIRNGTIIPGEYSRPYDQVITKGEALEMIIIELIILFIGMSLVWYSRKTLNKQRQKQTRQSAPLL